MLLTEATTQRRKYWGFKPNRFFIALGEKREMDMALWLTTGLSHF